VRPVITGLVVSVAACVLALGCGGDDPEPEAAVVWLNFSQGTGGNCDRPYSFQLPDSAAAIIQGQIEGSERVEDGAEGNVIDCSVRSTTGGAFQLSLQLRSPEIRIMQISGTVTEGASTVSLSVQSDFVGSLRQNECSARVKKIRNGAIWIDELRCENMTDARSPLTDCVGAGGVLFERCQG
jgi:hypothetical protein